jgi:hypothetical protein
MDKGKFILIVSPSDLERATSSSAVHTTEPPG